MSRVAIAFYWPHPLVWPLWQRLRLEAERACDDAVIRGESAAEAYAEQLVALARRLVGHGEVPALAMATRSHLGLRVEAILDRGLRRGRLGPFGWRWPARSPSPVIWHRAAPSHERAAHRGSRRRRRTTSR